MLVLTNAGSQFSSGWQSHLHRTNGSDMRLWFLILLLAAVILAILRITGVIPSEEMGGIALKTFGSLAVLLVASVAWKAVRGRSDLPDSTDQPVP